MKYYVNRETNLLLRDENNYTPYLQDRGYEEITKNEYDELKNLLLAKMQEEEEDGDRYNDTYQQGNI